MRRETGLQDASYDPELQMFTDAPHVPNLACLRFWRWFVEQGRLEHPPAGPPSGLYALCMAVEYPEVERGWDAVVSAWARGSEP